LIDSKSEWFDETTTVFRQVLDQVATNLNEIHNVNYSTRYWNIFLGAWLQQFVDMVMIRMRDKSEMIHVTEVTSKTDPATSLRAFNENAKSSVFIESLNADVFSRIDALQTSNSFSVSIKNDPENINKKVNLGRIFSSATYLPRTTEILLQLRYGRLPKGLNNSQISSFTRNHQQRALICKTNRSVSKNAEIVLGLLPKYMPCAYVEGFDSLFKTQKPWNSKRFPRVILTANRHLYDDAFNFWAALAAESGSRLVLAQHGGNYGISEFPSFSERHETLIADRYITWGWDSAGATYKGFALPLIGRALHSSQPNGSLLVVTDQLWKYPRSIFSDMSESSTYLDHLKSTMNGLQPEIRHNALLRIHHAHQDAASSQIDWWKLHAPDIKQDLGDINFETRLNESRLLLIAHNGTSIPEAIALNAPTIITWSDSYMKVRKSAEAVFDALEAAGVFHRTPESAASFINLIWNDVDGWWNSHATIEARKQFADQYARTVPNPVRFLAQALQF
jgi:putative transferase (TIGR04331 family)